MFSDVYDISDVYGIMWKNILVPGGTDENAWYWHCLLDN